MRKSLLALASLTLPLFAASAPAYADCNDPFGKPNEVLDFHISMSKADWTALLADKIPNVDDFGGNVDSPACAGKFKKFKAEFRCGTTGPWLKIGVRKKKGTERGIEVEQKPPLKLDINEDFGGMVPEAMGQRWPMALGELGFRKLTLNNGQGNKAPAADMKENFMLPMIMTEHVALRLLNKELPTAPKTAYAKVTMYFDDPTHTGQGEYHGVYVLVEDIDRTAIERRIGMGNAKGKLIKASTPDCTPEVQFDDMGDNKSLKAFNEWVSKDPALCGMNWLEETKKGLDLDALLRQEAIREILVNGNDTIINSRSYLMKEWYGDGNNWYAFDPLVGLRQYMPWDVDLTFGNQRGACMTPTPMSGAVPTPGVDGGPPGPPGPVADNRWKCPPDMPLLAWCNNGGILSTPGTFSRLGRATACNPTIQKTYLQTICKLINGPMSAAEILKVWEEANTAIAPIVPLEKGLWGGKDPSDPNAFKSYGAEYVRLKAWIPKRIDSVREQLNKLGVTCMPGCPANAREACSYAGGAGERRCVANAWTACLKVTAPVPGPTADAGAGTDAMSCGGDAGALRGDAPPPPPPPVDAGADAASSGSGGASGSGGSGSGTGGRRGTGGSPSSSSGTPLNEPTKDGGCGCRVGGEPSTSGTWALVLLGLVGLAGARRARRRR